MPTRRQFAIASVFQRTRSEYGEGTTPEVVLAVTCERTLVAPPEVMEAVAAVKPMSDRDEHRSDHKQSPR